jgi:hypothetical protein
LLQCQVTQKSAGWGGKLAWQGRAPQPIGLGTAKEQKNKRKEKKAAEERLLFFAGSDFPVDRRQAILINDQSCMHETEDDEESAMTMHSLRQKSLPLVGGESGAPDRREGLAMVNRSREREGHWTQPRIKSSKSPSALFFERAGTVSQDASAGGSLEA